MVRFHIIPMLPLAPAGELAIKCSGEELKPFVLGALERLVAVLQVPTGALPRSLVENAAITLGRLAWMCPEPLAPHAAAFLGPWCAALRGIRDDIEKEHAFLGLCALLRLNPQVRGGSRVNLPGRGLGGTTTCQRADGLRAAALRSRARLVTRCL